MLFVRLDVNFQDDDRLVEVSAEAELVFVRSLALAKRLASDGAIRVGHLRRLCDKLPGAPDQYAHELIGAGLWITEGRAGTPGERFVIPSWLKWNLSADEIDETRSGKSAGGRLGNHRRWGHKGPVDECETCNPSDGTDRSHSESLTDRIASRMGSVSQSPESESESENPPARAPAREAPPVDNTEPGGTPDTPTPTARVLTRIIGDSPDHISQRLQPALNGRHTRLVDQALAAGWTPPALADALTGNWSGVSDPAAVLTRRLEHLGAPPPPHKPPDYDPAAHERHLAGGTPPDQPSPGRDAAIRAIRATLTTDTGDGDDE